MHVYSLTDDAFEGKLLELGLTFERIQLKTKPNAIHWHIRKPGEKGTLEATFESGMVSLYVRANRAAGWMDAILDALA
jgi:hypothetical protein